MPSVYLDSLSFGILASLRELLLPESLLQK